MKGRERKKTKKALKHKGMQVGVNMNMQLASVILLIIVVMVAAIGGIDFRHGRNQMIENTMESNGAMSGIVAQQVDLYMTASIDTMKTLVNALEFDKMDKYDKNIALSKITGKSPQFKAVYMTDLEGNVVASTNSRRDEGKNYNSAKWFQEAVKGQTHISEALIDEDSKMPIIIMAIPIEGTLSGISGVMAVDLRLDRLYYLTRDMKIGETGFSYIVDQAGNVIAHPDFQSKVLQKVNAVEQGVASAIQVIKGENGVEIYTDMEGRKVIGGYSVVPTTGWGVITEQQYEEIMASSKESLKRTIWISFVFILLGLMISYFFAKYFTKPIMDMMKVIHQIKEGDLTERIVVSASNEIGVLQGAFNDMADSLEKLIDDVDRTMAKIQSSTGELEQNAQLTSKAVVEIAAVIDEVAGGSGKQIDSVNQTTNIVSQMVDSVKGVTENSMGILKSSSEASEVAKKGVQNIEQINNTMVAIDQTVGNSALLIKELTVHTAQIGDIVKVIKQISDQTNLLALNAAIEAARAGEHGRGFSVVADEVRKLAEQSSQASTGIVDLIQKIQDETYKVVQTMESSLVGVRKGTQVISETTQSFYDIIGETQKVANEVEAFTGVVEELTSGMDLVEQAIHEVSQISEVTAAGTEVVSSRTAEQDRAVRNIHQSVKELSAMTQDLEQVIRRFSISRRNQEINVLEEVVEEEVVVEEEAVVEEEVVEIEVVVEKEAVVEEEVVVEEEAVVEEEVVVEEEAVVEEEVVVEEKAVVEENEEKIDCASKNELE